MELAGYGRQCSKERLWSSREERGSEEPEPCYVQLDMREEGDIRLASVYKPDRRRRLQVWQSTQLACEHWGCTQRSLLLAAPVSKAPKAHACIAALLTDDCRCRSGAFCMWRPLGTSSATLMAHPLQWRLSSSRTLGITSCSRPFWQGRCCAAICCNLRAAAYTSKTGNAFDYFGFISMDALHCQHDSTSLHLHSCSVCAYFF